MTPALKKKGLRAIKRLKGKKTVILTSHEIPMLQQICDRTFHLDKGIVATPDYTKAKSFLKLLDENSEFICQASSGSMYPEINKGDDVLIRKISYNRLKVGDIAAFSFDDVGKIVIHRIVAGFGKARKKFLTKGDSSFQEDPWFLTKKSYVGKVVKVIKKS